jgi:hypothetical protein
MSVFVQGDLLETAANPVRITSIAKVRLRVVVESSTVEGGLDMLQGQGKIENIDRWKSILSDTALRLGVEIYLVVCRALREERRQRREGRQGRV